MEEEFEEACNAVKKLVSKLGEADLLYLYARYKQTTDGKCNIPKPAFYNFEAKRKWSAWQELGDMTSSTARLEYVMKLDEVCCDWRDLDEAPVSTAWVSISRPVTEEDEEKQDIEKTVWDWLKDNDVGKVKEFVSDGGDVNMVDDEGLSLLHWASDRGYVDVINTLLSSKLRDVDIRDGDGQTSLHYAASCGHMDAVKLLLKAGADKLCKDNDDIAPVDLADDQQIKTLLEVVD